MMQTINTWLNSNQIDWGKIVWPIVTILLAMLFFQVVKSITKRLFKASSARVANAQRRQRVDTIRTLVVSVEKYVVIFITIVIILSRLIRRFLEIFFAQQFEHLFVFLFNLNLKVLYTKKI